MKRSISQVLLAAAAAAVFLSACSKVPEQSRFIPRTAGIVFDINAKDISQKLVTEGVTMDKLFNSVQEKQDTGNTAMKAWKEAENSGVDLKNHFYGSCVFQKNGTENTSYLSMVAALTDATKFEEYLKKNIPNFSLKQGKDFKYVWHAGDQSIIGWNKETMIYVRGFDARNLSKLAPAGIPGADLPSPDEAPVTEDTEVEAGADTVAAPTPTALADTAEAETEKLWATELDHLFHLKKEDAATSIEAFSKMLKNNADLGMYVNPEAIYNGQVTMLPANFKKLMEGTFSTAAINFEKGKIVMESDTHMGKELADIYKKYGKKEIDMDMVRHFPSDSVTGIFAYAFDFRILGDIIKSTGVDGIANMALGRYAGGLTLDDILNAFEGQLVYIASDFKINKKESAYFPGEFRDEPTAKWIFNLKVGNKDAFNKLMSSPLAKEMFVKKGDKYEPVNPISTALVPPFSITDKFVTMASDSLTLEQYLSGKGKVKLPGNVENVLKGKTMGGYVNLASIMKVVPDEKADTAEKVLIAKVRTMFNDANIYADEVKGNTQHARAELNFANTSQNSLAQLLNLATEYTKVKDAQKAREKAYVDSLYALPVNPEDSALMAH